MNESANPIQSVLARSALRQMAHHDQIDDHDDPPGEPGGAPNIRGYAP